jgi:ABC-type lipoprotein export system ATPase subunit
VVIDRIQVQEGFLDGLDLQFSPGLNVIIGARGTGKTSIIELIRFCLSVKGYTAESNQRSMDHALSILGSGEARVSIEDDALGAFDIRRTAEDEEQEERVYPTPIIFSQTEIENVGLQPSGRLRLIDSFIDDRREIDTAETAGDSQVRSLTAEAQELRHEIEGLQQELSNLPVVEQQLQALLPSEQRLSKISVEAAQKKTKIDELSKLGASHAVSSSYIARHKEALDRWHGAIRHALQSIPPSERWSDATVIDPLAPIRTNEREAVAHLQAAADAIVKSQVALVDIVGEWTSRRRVLEEQSRELRAQVEGLQEGAGAIVRAGQELRERRAQLQSLRAVLTERQAKLSDIIRRRDSALDELDKARERRFQKRSEITRQLSEKLGPRIRVEIERAGQFDTYASAIAEILRGSGLRYYDLSRTLAENVSPRELLEAAEADDIEALSDAAGITKDRAGRVLTHIRESNGGRLATTLVEDNVYFKLLDGQDYKDFSALSTGQRCTVVLPILLEHTGRILIVDQPEDHIDNSFIVDTLIKSLSERNISGQIIFATHNANIPVLGNADHVVQMGSDGRRGFVAVAGPLESPAVVKAIVTVMEGGADAFRRRAQFYSKHKT